jgi:hypothetical protein
MLTYKKIIKKIDQNNIVLTNFFSQKNKSISFLFDFKWVD